MRYFIDTEFIENGRTIDLISVAICAEDGREYYAQRDRAPFKDAGDFVARNVLPHLEHFDLGKRERSCRRGEGVVIRGVKYTAMCCGPNGFATSPPCPWRAPRDLMDDILAFCDPARHGPPEFWGYYAAYDWVALCQLFGTMDDLPRGWPMYCHDYRAWLDEHALEHIKQPPDSPHHALSDARWVRDSFAATYRPTVQTVARKLAESVATAHD
jgi:hypothetical protein